MRSLQPQIQSEVTHYKTMFQVNWVICFPNNGQQTPPSIISGQGVRHKSLQWIYDANSCSQGCYNVYIFWTMGQIKIESHYPNANCRKLTTTTSLFCLLNCFQTASLRSIPFFVLVQPSWDMSPRPIVHCTLLLSRHLQNLQIYSPGHQQPTKDIGS